MLSTYNADALIWGSVARGPNESGLRLRFLPPIGEGTRPRGYMLNPKNLELQEDFGPELGAVLVPYVVDSLMAALREGRNLDPILKKLAPLAKAPPASFTVEHKAVLQKAYASVCHDRAADR
jgi:hypothetical protein